MPPASSACGVKVVNHKNSPSSSSSSQESSSQSPKSAYSTCESTTDGYNDNSNYQAAEAKVQTNCARQPLVEIQDAEAKTCQEDTRLITTILSAIHNLSISLPPTNVLIRFTNLTLGPVYDKADTACRSLGSALSDLTATAIIPGPWSLQLRRFGFEFAVSRSGCLLLPNSVDSHLIDSDSGSDADDEPENSKGCLWTQGLYCVPRDSGDIQVQAGTEVLPKHIMTLGHLIMRPQSEDTNHKHKTTTSIDTDDEAPFYFENKYWNPTGYQVVIDLQDSGLPVWIIRDEAWLENYERPYSFRNIIDAIGGKGMARFSAAKILSSCRDWQKKEVEESRGLIEQTRCWVRSARIDAWYSS